MRVNLFLTGLAQKAALLQSIGISVVFGFFCGMMVLQLIWVKLMVVETKGVPLEDVEKKLGVQQ